MTVTLQITDKLLEEEASLVMMTQIAIDKIKLYFMYCSLHENLMCWSSAKDQATFKKNPKPLIAIYPFPPAICTGICLLI